MSSRQPPRPSDEPLGAGFGEFYGQWSQGGGGGRADSSFEELEVDSLSRIELLVELEREFELESDEEEQDDELVNKIQSVEDAARMVESSLATQDAA